MKTKYQSVKKPLAPPHAPIILDLQRRRKNSIEWEEYNSSWQGQNDHSNLLVVAHYRPSPLAPKMWVYAKEGDSISGRLPWTPSLRPASEKWAEVSTRTGRIKKSHIAIDGRFVINTNIINQDILLSMEELRDNLPWERHPFTAFRTTVDQLAKRPCAAPKRRALLTHIGYEREQAQLAEQAQQTEQPTATPLANPLATESSDAESESSDAESLDSSSPPRPLRGELEVQPIAQPAEPTQSTVHLLESFGFDNQPMVYHPHRSVGDKNKPMLAMRSVSYDTLHKLAKCIHILTKEHTEEYSNCLLTPKTCAETGDQGPVRYIGEFISYAENEELRWHSDGNQVSGWQVQQDVLSSVILIAKTDKKQPTTPHALGVSNLSPTLAIKPWNQNHPQIHLHPSIGSKIDLLGTGAIADHARIPVLTETMVFVGRYMVDEQLDYEPSMGEKCPYDGNPVPQPMTGIKAQYGVPRESLGTEFDSIMALKQAGIHVHVGYHGSCLSSTMCTNGQNPFAFDNQPRGVQSIIDYGNRLTIANNTGTTFKYCVHGRPRSETKLSGRASALAFSGAIGAPIQYILHKCERHTKSSWATQDLDYKLHTMVYVHDWWWRKVGQTDLPFLQDLERLPGSRQDHCTKKSLTAQKIVDSEESWFLLYATLQTLQPTPNIMAKLRTKLESHYHKTKRNIPKKWTNAMDAALQSLATDTANTKVIAVKSAEHDAKQGMQHETT